MTLELKFFLKIDSFFILLHNIGCVMHIAEVCLTLGTGSLFSLKNILKTIFKISKIFLKQFIVFYL